MPAVFEAFTLSITVSAGSYAVASALAAAWNAFVVNTVLSLATRAIMGRPKGTGPDRPSARDITVQGSTEPRIIVLGQVRTSGVLVFLGSSGDKNQYLHYVIAVAGHQCEDIDLYWLDDKPIVESLLDANGDVTGGMFAGKVRIRKYLGTDAQVASTELVDSFSEWTTDHRGRGVTWVHIRLETDEKLFPNGSTPRSFFFRVKGVRAYDPRLDSTNGGSGSHRYNDPTTWTWTQNAALLQAFYLTGGSIVFDVNNSALQGHLGFGASPNDIAWSMVAAAANVCDEDVAIPEIISGVTTQKRYTANGVISTANTLADNMEQLLTASVGQLVYTNGSYELHAGAWEPPTISLNEDDLAGEVEFIAGTPRDRRYNAVRGTYFSALHWQEAEFVPKTSAAYQARDGGRQLWRDIVLPFTDDGLRAQRIAQLHLNQSDNQRILKWPGQLSCFKVPLWRTVNVTLAELGLSNDTFRCVGWEFNPEGTVTLELREDHAASYADPLTSDYGTIAVETPIDNQDDIPAAPTNLTALSTPSGIQFSWNLPATLPAGSIVELWEHTSPTPFSSATLRWAGLASGKFISRTDTTLTYWWIRLKANGQYSATEPSGNGVPGKASSVSAALSASVSPGAASGVDDNSDGTASTNAVTVTAAGGTPGYTYAWTWASGGSGISIGSPSSATTTFSATGLSASGETRSGTARCTVTDSASGTFTVDVAVTLSRVADVVSISSVAVQASDPSSATAGYRLDSDGKIYTGLNGVFSAAGDWVVPNGSASNYECRATLISGSISSGTLGAWLPLNADRTWTRTRSTPGVSTCQIIIDVRKVGNATVLDSATIELTAEVLV